jgi:hypothetical protein
MRRFQRTTICLLFSCLLLSVGFASDPIARGLLALPWEGVLPKDQRLGQIVDSQPGNNDGYSQVAEAFRAEFGTQWFDRYVDGQLHASLNRVHGAFLAEHLPFSAVMVGRGASSEGLLSLPLKAVDEDGVVFLLHVVLSRTAAGNWVLVAIGSIERSTL